MDSKYLFVVRRQFKTADGRECHEGDTVELKNRDEVRALLSLGFVIPGGRRTTDLGTPTPRKFKAVNDSTFYTRGQP